MICKTCKTMWMISIKRRNVYSSCDFKMLNDKMQKYEEIACIISDFRINMIYSIARYEVV